MSLQLQRSTKSTVWRTLACTTLLDGVSPSVMRCWVTDAARLDSFGLRLPDDLSTPCRQQAAQCSAWETGTTRARMSSRSHAPISTEEKLKDLLKAIYERHLIVFGWWMDGRKIRGDLPSHRIWVCGGHLQPPTHIRFIFFAAPSTKSQQRHGGRSQTSLMFHCFGAKKLKLPHHRSTQKQWLLVWVCGGGSVCHVPRDNTIKSFTLYNLIIYIYIEMEIVKDGWSGPWSSSSSTKTINLIISSTNFT